MKTEKLIGQLNSVDAMARNISATIEKIKTRSANKMNTPLIESLNQLSEEVRKLNVFHNLIEY